MKNKIFYFLTLILLTTLTGCEENAEPTGIDFVTFETQDESYVLDLGSTLNAEYKVYTATKVGSDTSFNVTVGGSIGSSSYNVPATVTIPANSNEGTLSISISENNFDTTNGETLTLALSSDGYFLGETLTIVVNVFCPSQIAGNYAYSDGNMKAATITAGSGINNFVVSGDNQFGSNYSFNINDQCGSISVTGGFLPDNFGIAVSGSGTVMANGNVVIDYTVDGYFSATMTLVPQ